MALALLGCLVGTQIEAQDWQKPATPMSKGSPPPQEQQVRQPPPPPQAPRYPQMPQVQPPPPPQAPQYPQVQPPPPPQVLPPQQQYPQYPKTPQVQPPQPKVPQYPQVPKVQPPPPKVPQYSQTPQVQPPQPRPQFPQHPQTPQVQPPPQQKVPQYPQVPKVQPPPPPKVPQYSQTPQVQPPQPRPQFPQHPQTPQVQPPQPRPQFPQHPQTPQVQPPPQQKVPQYPQVPKVQPPPPPKVPQYSQTPQVQPPQPRPQFPQHPQTPQVQPPPQQKVPQYPQVPKVQPPPPPKVPQYSQTPQVQPPQPRPQFPQHPQTPQVQPPPQQKVPQYPQVPKVQPPPPPKVPQYSQAPQVQPQPPRPQFPQYPQKPQQPSQPQQPHQPYQPQQPSQPQQPHQPYQPQQPHDPQQPYQPQQPHQPTSPQVPSIYQPSTPKQPSFESCEVSDSQKVPCGGPDISAGACEAISCCFDGRQCHFGKAVTVQCTKDAQFIVVVARDATLPNIDLESISLLGEGQGCTHVDSNSAFAIYQFPVTACGSVVMEEPGVIIYENRMSSSYEVGVGPLGAITRDSFYELLFQCRYTGTSVETLVVQVLPLENPPLPVAALGPIRVHLRLANGQCNTKGCNEGDVAYSSYYTEADYPVTKVLRDPVYVEVQLLEKTDPNLVLTLGRCWTTTSPNPHSMPQWDILIDGCPYRDDRYLSSLVPVDQSSGLYFPSHYRRFIFKMFTFVSPDSLEPLREQVYIHCSTAVCSAAPGRSCDPSCFRKKRDVKAAIQKTAEPKVVVSAGPVIIGPAEQ
uniref:zona pellucida sperm-binding protein 1-like n=1 Tax=Semicossyphus pulcher TaxID=241346 RepID=UPI0037E8B309